MRNTLLALSVALLGVAVAQKISPAVVDGKTVPNGIVTVNGKQYLSIDALKQSGIQFNGSNAFILTNPKANQPAYKLNGV